jgi:hypothetical protein
MTILGIDWGGYDYDLRLAELRQAGVEYVISQAGGAGTPRILAEARELGYATGTYWWNQALISPQAQIDQFAQYIEADNPDFLIMDYEHWWKYWSQYWDAIGGVIPWSSVERLPAAQISENGRLVAEGIAARYPDKLFLVYTAAWFTNQYAPQSATWLKNYPLHVASYPDYGVDPYNLAWEEIRAGVIKVKYQGQVIEQNIHDYQPTLPIGLTDWKMWQYSSRIKIPGAYYAYDWDLFDGTIEELGGTKPMAMTYRQDVPQEERANLVILSADDNPLDLAAVFAQADSVGMTMLSQSVREGPVQLDTAFKARIAQAGPAPALGWVTMDAGYPLWVKQQNLKPFQDRPWTESETLEALLYQWRSVPFTHSDYTSGRLNITATDGKWNRLHGLILYIGNARIANTGGEIPGVWQIANIKDILKNLNSFMAGGYVPKIPIWLVCGYDYTVQRHVYDYYAQDANWNTGLKELVSTGWLTGVGMLEVGKAGLYTETPMANAFSTLTEVFQYRPSNQYAYSVQPYDLEDRMHIDIYSFNRFRAVPIKAGASPIMVGCWHDRKEQVYRMLGWEVTEPPEPPQPPSGELEARVELLEKQVASLYAWIQGFQG